MPNRSKTWALTSKQIEKMEIWEQKRLRSVLRGIKENKEWRRTNKELADLLAARYNVYDSNKKWLGHLKMMNSRLFAS